MNALKFFGGLILGIVVLFGGGIWAGMTYDTYLCNTYGETAGLEVKHIGVEVGVPHPQRRALDGTLVVLEFTP